VQQGRLQMGSLVAVAPHPHPHPHQLTSTVGRLTGKQEIKFSLTDGGFLGELGSSLLLKRNQVSIGVFRNKPSSTSVSRFWREKRSPGICKLCVALVDVLNDEK
jgi:hypothetical protein